MNSRSAPWNAPIRRPSCGCCRPRRAGERAYALALGRSSTAVWLVAGGAFGPEHARARCRGAARAGSGWTGRAGCSPWTGSGGGRTKAVVVDLERGGEVSPLLQIADGQQRPAAARRPGQRAAADPLGRALARARPARLGGAGQHRCRCASRSACGSPDCARDAVRHPAGAGADAGELRGGAAHRRRGGQLGRRVAPGGAAAASTGRARGLAGGGRAVEPGGGAATAVRDGGGAVRGGADRRCPGDRSAGGDARSPG